MLPRPYRTGARRRSGNSIVEFAISLPFLALMTVGTFAMGVMIDRHLTVAQLVRNAGSMYARGVDFSVDTNKDVLLTAATGMQMTKTSGLGVIYLSTVVLATPGTGLTNDGMPVVSHRIHVGSAALDPSPIGMPFSIAASGAVDDFEDDPTARATLPAGITMVVNERLYFAEVIHTPTDLSFPGFFALGRLYSRAVF